MHCSALQKIHKLCNVKLLACLFYGHWKGGKPVQLWYPMQGTIYYYYLLINPWRVWFRYLAADKSHRVVNPPLITKKFYYCMQLQSVNSKVTFLCLNTLVPNFLLSIGMSSWEWQSPTNYSNFALFFPGQINTWTPNNTQSTASALRVTLTQIYIVLWTWKLY